MMLRNPSASLLSLLILAALAIPLELLPVRRAALAQTATPSPTLPVELPKDPVIRLDGSSSMRATNAALKNQFRAKYPGSQIEEQANGSDAALKALLEGKIDLAAIGRPLTQAEREQGLVAVPVGREKLAIFVGANNSFSGDLTFEQFARIFRGEITDWSEVGGAPGPIRFVDRPETSDTRRTLRTYKVFEGIPFETGQTAAPVNQDETDAVVANLGEDGIGYGVVSQVANRQDVKIVPMHKTLPTDPRYPYSQPRFYVYRKGAVPIGAAAFLGLTGTPEGAAVVANETATKGQTAPPAPVEPTPPSGLPPAPPSPEASPAPVAIAPAPVADPSAIPWWWYLLPFLALLLPLFLLLRRRSLPPTSMGTGADTLPPRPISTVPPAEKPAATAATVSKPDAAARVTPPTVPASAVVTPPSVPSAPPATIPATAVGLGAAAIAAASLGRDQQSTVEANKYDVGQPDAQEALADVDAGLAPLPSGYGSSQIVLMPRDPQWAYSYWDTPEVHKEAVRRQGGQRLALRLYDVTGVDLNYQAPNSLQQYDIDELAREWYLPIPISDRDYLVDIGYLSEDGRWLLLARSNPIRIPPVYPSDQLNEQQITVSWDENLQGQTLSDLTLEGMTIHEQMYQLAIGGEAARVAGSVYGSRQQVPGSVPGSVQMVESSYGVASGAALTLSGVGLMSGVGIPGYALSGMGLMSGVGIPGYAMSGAGLTMSGVGMGYAMSGVGLTMSGVGMGYAMSGAGLTMSGVGLTMSGVGMGYAMSGAGLTMSGVGLTMSGVGMGYAMSGVGLTMSGVGLTMSGVGMGYAMSGAGLTMSGVGLTMSGVGMSGVGFFSSMPPIRARKFWLLADSELIVYGATEPDATLYIAGNLVPLNPDGTFRFHLHFPDGLQDFPILAIAADGEQTRTIHMRFNRETPERRTNAKEEAIEEVF